MSVVSLANLRPQLHKREIIENLVPPKHFAESTFESYLPDAAQPSQAIALIKLKEFAAAIDARRSWFSRSGNRLPGVYLDGGFGVGKTHLLAGLWHQVQSPKLFGTFVEFTNLVGAFGFQETVKELAKFKLICIDEFELDDPGDTVLMSTLLLRLVEQGVWFAATSNTLPDRLGEERFAADDFVREIQGLAAHFETVRVDGDDYRHRGLPAAPNPANEAAIRAVTTALPPGGNIKTVALDDFDALDAALVAVHPSRYAGFLQGVDAIALLNVRTLHDQAKALRWVVLADRLYDREMPLIYSGVPLDQLFATELLAGGYRKKYRRAISRLVALSRDGERLLHG